MPRLQRRLETPFVGETFADIARHQKAGGESAKLVIGHKSDGLKHRAKFVIDELDFPYGDTQALKKVCLAIPEYQVTGMIGPSGCGKSTLLRVLNRMYSMYPGQRATGTVRIDGEDIIRPDIDLKRLRSRVGMVFQEATVFPMSIYENVAFGARLHERLSHAEQAARVEEALIRVGLWSEVKDRLKSSAGSLSGGQQQRLCIARTLSTQPEVVLMDEPTSALDPVSMLKVEDLIDELKKTLIIVLVAHNMQQAARCADQVAFFYLGEMIEAASAEQMFTSPRLPWTQNYITGRFG
jgi:phosphate transport system ATP-binding protein